MTPHVRQVLEEYSQGRFSAREAARRMGGDATVHDVIYQMREAHLPLPRRPDGEEAAQMAKALRMFGLTP